MPVVHEPVNGKSVIVIGGGVAGIATATALADFGFQVDLIEKRPLLGGRASSHVDPQTGMQIDECQHGTMRCCTSLADLLKRLGVEDQIRYHDTLRFLDIDGNRSTISGCGLPAPLHTSLSFLLFRSLGFRDKLGIAWAMIAMIRYRDKKALESLDIASWFAQLSQTEQAIKRFWSPILVSACNETIERISCTHAFKIFLDGFLLNHEAYHFGVPRVPLGTLYTMPTVDYLTKRGGRVRLKTMVDKLQFEVDGNGKSYLKSVSLQNRERLTAEYYVSALQHDLLLKLLPSVVTTGVPYWEQMRDIELSPIIGVHLWFDRVIECPEALATLDRETEWIFNKNLNFDLGNDKPTYLSAVISATHRYANTPKEKILARVLEDVRACLPEARNAELLKWQVVKWPKATFSPLPGNERFRPDQCSPISNLFVAGEWTNTEWPSTMESAARSGYRAAEYILKREGIAASIVAPGLKRGWLANVLSRAQRHE
jgi:zeta-carotene desaturase